MTEIHQVPGWPRPRGYSDAISAGGGGGRIVAIAGQVGWNPATQLVETDDFAAQGAIALRNVATAMKAAGCGPGDLLRATLFVTSREEYLASTEQFGAAWREVFGKHYPAMTLVIVAGLLEPRAKIEIEATAVVPG